VIDDPSTPSHATGDPIPVINKTGIAGIYDIGVDIKPDAGADTFTIWQRALRDQLGLKLESQKGAVAYLVVGHADRVPSGN